MTTTLEQGPTSRTYISQRLRLHYVDWGNPSAPLLLLLHGGRDHCRSWDWVARELCSEWHIIAPDLRGHGDSSWSADGQYDLPGFVYDLAQLIHQIGENVTVVGHSLGGWIALHYAGLYPETVNRLVAIEGLGLSPKKQAQIDSVPVAVRWRNWIASKRAAAGRKPKHYEKIEDALARMRVQNNCLTEEQARHLTVNGLNRNEDGTWSWKFDNHLNVWPFLQVPQSDTQALLRAISCPTLLLYGADSWASNPQRDGRLKYFQNARVAELNSAGHWLHHDQFAAFMSELRRFFGADGANVNPPPRSATE